MKVKIIFEKVTTGVSTDTCKFTFEKVSYDKYRQFATVNVELGTYNTIVELVEKIGLKEYFDYELGGSLEKWLDTHDNDIKYKNVPTWCGVQQLMVHYFGYYYNPKLKYKSPVSKDWRKSPITILEANYKSKLEAWLADDHNDFMLIKTLKEATIRGGYSLPTKEEAMTAISNWEKGRSINIKELNIRYNSTDYSFEMELH
jgi:hypothetical protein